MSVVCGSLFFFNFLNILSLSYGLGLFPLGHKVIFVAEEQTTAVT